MVLVGRRLAKCIAKRQLWRAGRELKAKTLLAAEQAAAPDRGPFGGPALKRLARCGLRPLRSRHVKARGR
jgi:hypothetical protein